MSIINRDRIRSFVLRAGRTTAGQQKAIDEVGLEMESFALSMAKADDKEVANVYKNTGAKVYDLDDAIIAKWKKIAQETAWADFSARNSECDRFLKLAQAVS